MATRTQLVSSLLSIDNIDDNVYRSEGPHIGNLQGPKRVFGGYVAAQVYKAVKEYAKKVQDQNVIFSMHYNFVAAGDPSKLIDIKVNQVESVYAVDVYHDNKAIGLGHIKTDTCLMKSPSFPADAPSLLSLPDISTVISLIPEESIRKEVKYFINQFVFDMRPAHFSSNASNDRVLYYARIFPEGIDQMQEDSGMVTVVALSDFYVFQSAFNVLKKSGFRVAAGGSMHHKVHFHQENVEPIQWFLVETRTEIVSKNKAKIRGAVFDSNKNCVISFIQEAYLVPERIKSKV